MLDVFDEWRRALGYGASAGGRRRQSTVTANAAAVAAGAPRTRRPAADAGARERIAGRGVRRCDRPRGARARTRRAPRRAACVATRAGRWSSVCRRSTASSCNPRGRRSTTSRAWRPRCRRTSWPRSRAAMPPEARSAALRDAAVDRLVRERFGLPIIAFICRSVSSASNSARANCHSALLFRCCKTTSGSFVISCLVKTGVKESSTDTRPDSVPDDRQAGGRRPDDRARRRPDRAGRRCDSRRAGHRPHRACQERRGVRRHHLAGRAVAGPAAGLQRPALRRLPLCAHRVPAPAGAESARHRRCVRAHRAPGAAVRGAWRHRRKRDIACARGSTCAVGGSGFSRRHPRALRGARDAAAPSGHV